MATSTFRQAASDEAEDFFRLAPCACHVLDADGRFVSVNAAALELLGYAREDVLGRRLHELIAPGGADRFAARFAQIGQTGAMRDTEVDLMRRDGAVVPAVINAVALRDANGRIGSIHAMVTDLRHHATLSRMVDLGLMAEAVCAIPAGDPVMFVDPELRIRFCTQALAGHIGRASWQDLIGQSCAAVFGSAVAGRIESDVRRLIDGAVPHVERENDSLIDDGRPGALHTRRWPVRGRAGNVIGVFSASRDVTPQLQAEQVLRECEARFEGVFRSSLFAIGISRMADGVLVDANDAFLRLFGYTREEVIGKRAQQYGIWPKPEARERMMAQLRESHDGAADVETQFRRKDGTIGEMSISARLATIGGEHHMIGAMVDISTRKQIERALRASEERYRAVVEDQTETISRFKPDGTIVFVNDVFCRLFGLSADEVVGKTWRPIAHPDDVAMVDARLSTLTPANPVVSIENRIRLPDGEMRWMQFVNRAFFDGEGRIVELQSVGRDITDRRVFEDALRASEERYRAVVEDQTEAIARFKPDGTVLFVNDVYCRVFGLLPAELIGRTWRPVAHPDDVPMIEARLRTLSPANPVVTIENRVRVADGSERWMQFVNRGFFDAAGRLTELQAVGRDISERRAIEQALRVSEARYRAVVEDQTELIGRYLPDHTRVFVNEAYARFFGKTVDELVGKKWLPVVHPDDVPMFEAKLRTISPANPQVTIENRVYRADCSLRWLQFANRGLFDADGRLIETQAVGRDVTDRRLAEEALRDTGERYRAVVEQQTDLICRYLPDRTITFVNSVFCRTFGRTAEDLVGHKWQPLVHPADLASVDAMLQSLSPQNPVVTVENRIVRPDGEVRWMQFVNQGFFDDEGRLVELQGVGRDIDDRKQMELALRASEERFRAVVEDQTELIGRYRPDGTMVFVNEVYARFFGKTVEQLVGQRWFPSAYPDDLPMIEAKLRTLSPANPVVTIENRVYRADGVVRWMQFVNRGFFDEAGRLIESQSVGRDITQRKEIEAALVAANEHLEQRVLQRTRQLRQLALDTTLAEERERTAIARDLHDDLGQQLHVAKIKLGLLARRTDDAATRDLIDELDGLIGNASARVRFVTAQLSPPVLETLGLVPALSWLAEELERNYGLTVEASDDGLLKPLTSAHAAILFRAARELLINVHKHAQTHFATVDTRVDDGHIELRVADDGAGIRDPDTALAGRHGFGLASIHERIGFLNGSMRVDSVPGKGTTVVLRLPLDAPRRTE